MSFLEFRRELLKWVDESEEKNLRTKLCSHEVSKNMIKSKQTEMSEIRNF